MTVTVLTAEGLACEDEAVSVQAPGARGYLGVLRGHAPLVTSLQPGKFSWRRVDGEPRAVRIGKGLMEVLHNRLTVLTDRCAPARPEEPAGPLQ